MEALALAPDELWWLLGAVVAFYFGARELHYARRRSPAQTVKETAAIFARIARLRKLEEAAPGATAQEAAKAAASETAPAPAR